ncbi:MAG: hypothetical protein LJF30_00725 [Acidobacteria bacterium]|nr:hypothetical protein [Acidobacteriota bacterium]
MYFMSKLKTDRSVAFIVPALTTLALFLVALAMGGIRLGLLVLGLAFLLFAILALRSYWRTRNPFIIVQTVYLASVGLYALTVPRVWGHGNTEMARLLALVAGASAAWLTWIFFTKKLKFRGREILELAALPVKPDPDGFTERPRPSGRADCTREELLAFAAFLHRTHIAWAYLDATRVVFVPVRRLGYRYLYGWDVPDYEDQTWVAFDFDGNVSAQISREDYLDYREELSLDELSGSMGRLFIDMLEQFKRGEGGQILDRLNALGMSPVS